MRVPAARWLTVAVLAAAPAAAQAPSPPPPPGAAFRPLLADPKEPQFFAAYLWERSPRLAPRLGSVGFGQTFGVVNGRTWQVAVAAAVFPRSTPARPPADLMNTDYRIGLPVTYRRAGLTTRMQLYHQSSHLGDEYMVHANAQRVDLTFEAAELLVSQQLAAWRLYGGGEYVFTHSPADLKPAVLHAGVEYRQRGRLVRFGRLASGRVVARWTPLGLSLASPGVPHPLAEAREPLSLSELAQRQHCVRSNITQLVDRLEKDGLVRRRPDPDDRRGVLAALTPAGEQAYAKGMRALVEAQHAIVRALSAGDAKSLKSALDALAS